MLYLLPATNSCARADALNGSLGAEEGLGSHRGASTALSLRRLSLEVVLGIRLQVFEVDAVGQSAPGHAGSLIQMVNVCAVMQQGAGVNVGGPGDDCRGIRDALHHRA